MIIVSCPNYSTIYLVPTQDVHRIVDLTFELSRCIRCKLHEKKAWQSPMNWLQIHALMLIKDHLGITMKQFARAMRVTSPSATSFINRLVLLKLVARIADADNRKLVRLQLTPSAEKMLTQAMRQKSKSVSQLFHVIPPSDQRELARILEQLVLTLRKADHM